MYLGFSAYIWFTQNKYLFLPSPSSKLYRYRTTFLLVPQNTNPPLITHTHTHTHTPSHHPSTHPSTHPSIVSLHSLWFLGTCIMTQSDCLSMRSIGGGLRSTIASDAPSGLKLNPHTHLSTPSERCRQTNNKTRIFMALISMAQRHVGHSGRPKGWDTQRETGSLFYTSISLHFSPLGT